MSDSDRRGSLVRYTAELRTNHWLTALGFVFAALSGLALFHPALFWLSNLFGGGPWTRVLHPFIGYYSDAIDACESPDNYLISPRPAAASVPR